LCSPQCQRERSHGYSGYSRRIARKYPTCAVCLNRIADERDKRSQVCSDECRKIRDEKWRFDYNLKNRDHLRKYHREKHSRNRESRLRQQREYKKKNRVLIQERDRAWYAKNCERVKQRAGKYRLENLARVREYQKTYFLRNRPVILQRVSEHVKRIDRDTLRLRRHETYMKRRRVSLQQQRALNCDKMVILKAAKELGLIDQTRIRTSRNNAAYAALKQLGLIGPTTTIGG